ncbi:MAG: hypothetical protein JST16_04620 [Bdellovibrionales bacterium]|nr:hypothetical protein [Bdellovibrionales bacterium]
MDEYRARLSVFWPKGGPVWDGLAKIVDPKGATIGYVLIEAKSYPNEVRGGGCKAPKGSDSRKKIEASLLETAKRVGLTSRPDTWMRKLYQSANRIAHVLWLRETIGVEAYLVNVCFTGDPHRDHATTREEWEEASRAFRRELKLSESSTDTPWLIDVVVGAPRRAELTEEPSAIGD